MPRKGMRTLLCTFRSKQHSCLPAPSQGEASTSYTLASTPPRRNTQSMIDRSISMADLMVNKWNPDTSGYAQVSSIFYENRKEAMEFIKCVFNLQKSMHLIGTDDPNNNMVRAQKLMQIAMKRLQKEFYQILSTNRAHLDPESVSAHSSRTSSRSSISDIEDATAEDESTSTGESNSETEQVSLQAMDNLRCIAECMIAAGYAKECFKIYIVIRKSIIDEALYKLGIKKISQNKFNKLTCESQDLKIQQWLHATKMALKTLFAGEKILCNHVFEVSEPLRDSCFIEISRDAANLHFSFPELVSKSKKSTQMILRVIDIYATIVEHRSDIDAIFSSDSSSAVRNLAMNSLPKLADAARSMFLEFESAVQQDTLKANTAPVGGGVDPLTIYVMNSLSSLSDHASIVNDILSNLPPPIESPDSNSSGGTPAPAISVHVTRIIGIVSSQIANRSKLYKDASASFLFVANNLQHVVSTIRRSNLKYILGERWIRNQEDKINDSISSYVAAAWGEASDALPDATEAYSSTDAKERFKKFNERFGEAYRKQSACVVVNQRLRYDIKARVERKLVARYREFYEVNRRIVGAGSLNLVVRNTPEDVVNYLSDLYFDDVGGAYEGGLLSYSSPSLSVMSSENRFKLN